MSRLIIISNRLHVSVSKNGGLHYKKSVGGVATGLASVNEPKDVLWIGWPGIATEELTQAEQEQIREQLGCEASLPVFLSEEDLKQFYLGFCNRTIWPLFHYFPLYCEYDPYTWQAYRRVNEQYAHEVAKVMQPGDKVWVHDYQLMLLPGLLRKMFPQASIGFFLHIPFPSFELLRLLPWRQEILDGILGSDLIGFHEYDYVRHFLSSVSRISGYEQSLNQLAVNSRTVRVDAFPMGIDFEKFASSGDDPDVKVQIGSMSRQVQDNRKLIISVDRLDYTKGILNRLEAYDMFLAINHEYHGKVTLAVVAVPSRTMIPNYEQLRENIEQMVGRINGQYGTLDWTPIHYLYRSLPFESLAALYDIADVALITPLRDGMNLIAKEFIAANSRRKQQGVLILSEMAGAASELSEAIVVNPHDKAQMVTAIRHALEMPQEERTKRNSAMQQRLSRYNVGRWASEFLASLDGIKEVQEFLTMKRLSSAARQELINYYKDASQRLLLLDYDGTMVGFVKDPQKANPDQELLDLIRTLADDKRNDVVIISGRDKEILTSWLGDLPVGLIAEHGAFYRRPLDKDWSTPGQLHDAWKASVRPILELYVDRTPGSFIEEKSYSLVWHCRASDPDLARVRMHELRDAMWSLTTNLGIGVFEGSKIIEVKLLGVNKGAAAELLLSNKSYDFVLAVGDDYTDEDMFGALPPDAYSIKVGQGSSKARYRIDSVGELRSLLLDLKK